MNENLNSMFMYLGYKGPRDNLVLTELKENSDHREHLDHLEIMELMEKLSPKCTSLREWALKTQMCKWKCMKCFHVSKSNTKASKNDTSHCSSPWTLGRLRSCSSNTWERENWTRDFSGNGCPSRDFISHWLFMNDKLNSMFMYLGYKGPRDRGPIMSLKSKRRCVNENAWNIFAYQAKSNTKVKTIQFIAPHLGHLRGSGLIL